MMKLKIVKEVKRSDGLWRFACGDVSEFRCRIWNYCWGQTVNSKGKARKEKKRHEQKTAQLHVVWNSSESLQCLISASKLVFRGYYVVTWNYWSISSHINFLFLPRQSNHPFLRKPTITGTGPWWHFHQMIQTDHNVGMFLWQTNNRWSMFQL